jgi:hypothetical protein
LEKFGRTVENTIQQSVELNATGLRHREDELF